MKAREFIPEAHLTDPLNQPKPAVSKVKKTVAKPFALRKKNK